MIYTIDRETPDHDLQKATHEELDRIVALLEKEGIPAKMCIRDRDWVPLKWRLIWKTFSIGLQWNAKEVCTIRIPVSLHSVSYTHLDVYKRQVVIN